MERVRAPDALFATLELAAMNYAIDPELSQRRLRTLVRLLETEARHQAMRGRSELPPVGELDANEMRQWARQCANLLNGPMPRKAAKPIEQMSDEELLS